MFRRLPLTDEQWKQIATYSSIAADNDEARRDIEVALGLFRQFEADKRERMPPPEIRVEFRALADIARNLYERLSRLIEHRDAYEAITPDEAITYTGQRLSQTLDMLVSLPKWFLIAEHNVKKRRRGPQTDNVYWLVAQLDGIRRQWTGVRITRSYKDDASKRYIEYVCSVADPNITAGTIDKAMKARIKAAVD